MTAISHLSSTVVDGEAVHLHTTPAHAAHVALPTIFVLGVQAARPAPRELWDARDHRPARACAAGAAERLAAMLDEDGEADDEAAL